MALAEWISLSRTSGWDGTINVVVTASSYTELTDRITSFTVNTRHTNLSETVTIKQEHRIPSVFIVTPTLLQYDDLGGVRTISIYAEDDWVLVNRPNWWIGINAYDADTGLPSSSTGGTAGNYAWSIAVPDNSSSAREEYLIFECDGVQYQVKIEQSQYAEPVPLDVNPNYLVFSPEGSTECFTITTTGEWTITDYPDWVSLSKTSGLGNSTVCVTAYGNTGDTRDASLVINTHRNSVVVDLTQDTDSESLYRGQYFTIEITSGRGKICWYSNSTAFTKTIEYSKNNGTTWTSITADGSSSAATAGTTTSLIEVISGDKILFRGNNNAYCTAGDYDVKYCHFQIVRHPATGANFKVYGNIMSLIYGNSFISANALPSESTFRWLFLNSKDLVSAKNLVLPPTSLTSSCYRSMFQGCSRLEETPWKLPATTLAPYCYSAMFNGCTSLVKGPVLPATTLADACYWQMFMGCTSLTKAPALPALSLAYGCYSAMFNGCNSLTTAPELPATEPVGGCYGGMFAGCTNLNYIKCLLERLREDEESFPVTSDWVVGVQTDSGRFVKNKNLDWGYGLSLIPTNWNVYDTEPQPQKLPLTFNITGDGNIVWKLLILNELGSPRTIEYKLNDGSWTSITSTSAGVEIPVVSGDTIQFRGNNDGYGDNVYDDDLQTRIEYANCFCDSTAQFSVKGDIMSLINSSNFNTLTTLSSTNTFYYLFYNCTGLTDASELLLSATTLTSQCYSAMFAGCTSLVTAPELPATTLADSCYSAMFYICTSLTTAPSSIGTSATTMTTSACTNMFSNCASLTTAPALPSTTLALSCYADMFNGCTSLTTAPALPATTLANNCYQRMFKGCTSLTTAPELPATTLASQCYYQMFYNCTSLTTAPALLATTLIRYCYRDMFRGCTSLNYIKCLATDISASQCTYNWVSGVASTGTFVKNPSMTGWTTGNNGIPSNWTIQDAS